MNYTKHTPCDLCPFRNDSKRLFVEPSQRATGLGRRLAEAIMTDAAEAGFARMFLVTTEEMKAARALYSKLGFAVCAPYRKLRTSCPISMDLALPVVRKT